MRTLKQIVSELKEAFVQNEVLIEAYGLTSGQTFDEQFSVVSLEAAIISIVALAHYFTQQWVAGERAKIEQRMDSITYGSVAWWHSRILGYQEGHGLEYNSDSYLFEYSVVDESARIVKFAAVTEVVDTVTKLKIRVNKADFGILSSAELGLLESYVRRIGPPGLHYVLESNAPDLLRIVFQVIYDPLVLNRDGEKIIGGNKPAVEAVEKFVANLTYGGVLNVNKLIDAIQSAEGVVDVVFSPISHAAEGESYVTVDSPDVISEGGGFFLATISDTYTPAT